MKEYRYIISVSFKRNLSADPDAKSKVKKTVKNAFNLTVLLHSYFKELLIKLLLIFI